MRDAYDSDDAANPERGSGSDCAPNTRDVRLTALAIREQWPLDPDAKAAAVLRLEEWVRSPNTKPRAFYAAVKALMGLSRVNLTAVATALNARAQEELAERMAAIEERLKQGDRDHEP
jgi:hypothetical protein